MTNCTAVTGEFVTLAGERYYAIRNVDNMAPFFISVVSDSDHWMFIASTGGLTAGRISPETALFPYINVDCIYESTPHTGSKTLLRTTVDGETYAWEPFNQEHNGRYQLSRNLYKNTLGNKLLFEEINHDLQLSFRYSWASSDKYGFVRQSEIHNLNDTERTLEILDGLQNILPAGTPRFTQTNTSYLVDAYKWNELDSHTGLAMFTLFSGITDRAEPAESLRATTVFALGLSDQKILLSARQIDRFRQGLSVEQETQTRGVRGAFWLNTTLKLAAKSDHVWRMVANLEQSQSETVALQAQLADPDKLSVSIDESIVAGSDALSRIMASGDAFQLSAEETVSVHHYANVQFNVMRGGIFDEQYQIDRDDFSATIKLFNQQLFSRHQHVIQQLPEKLDYSQLLAEVQQQNDPQLLRLCYEYLPITFGRRHGDPSRPWNQFAIKLKDEQGNRLLSYQGNWRDIFQNWEALMLSYPEFIENVIATFVNASTMDGYNPYRITKEGIDWEVEEPDDPWSYIGYWGDHQIIYLQKLLELSQQFHPQRLKKLLQQAIFSYANVPYKIKPFAALLENAKSTVVYDHELADQIDARVASMGADGKLVVDADGQVYQVNLTEKLLVPLLSKLGNLVVGGGIWLNTQRPEWNDANNALVGQGLSMVTMYYMRRYTLFLKKLLTEQVGVVSLTREVSQWLTDTAQVLEDISLAIASGPINAEQRYQFLVGVGEAASRYRQTIYHQEVLSGGQLHELDAIHKLLDNALNIIDHSIQYNQRKDGLYHAYNVLSFEDARVNIDPLYLMLEGQVAALSSGAIPPKAAVKVLETLFDSAVFRPDQNSFLLYPDRDLPGFLEKNQLPTAGVTALPLLTALISEGNCQVIEQDLTGCYRFNGDIHNGDDLNHALDALIEEHGDKLEIIRKPLQKLYESVFNHKAFTGRSGGMFGFEGLGSIYWHMVSKLMLTVQENFFAARSQADDATAKQLGDLYYRVREGIGFNKTPEDYGAFPTDPYSHTPKHIGAQQPGMTGQVKEEMMARFAELGIRVSEGEINFDPCLLRPCEFIDTVKVFRFLDVHNQWQEFDVPENGLAFTWCQLPLVYRICESQSPALTVTLANGDSLSLTDLRLPADLAEAVFTRNGFIEKLELTITSEQLF
ncbi:hypothetical protein GP2143_05985 [marine gamma proteobacterium HTCC2143]|uniref:Uncharacterized protein n=1 Tax=marine gamma proteobacterium HTCC2143 TaxID=247633 RepID=A0YBP7_9GAMM|nr:hypothetical protein GP2143_05985 [marine gamma proteobacterium HTCC2143]